ncbi:MAG: class I mannose-6-phosphate isomerase [Akkermansiaceae bacterium]|nr:class I mannose-6-phosphate isomerase [Akkermansiaceae bacterium]
MNPVEPTAEPLVFTPIYQTRVWGGRALESRFGRSLPDPSLPFGESWEIADRPEAESVVAGAGPFAGRTLGELWRGGRRHEIFGADSDPAFARSPERFPLLCKILDARERLSLQVHPPASVAAALGGEPKTELWVVAHAEPGAELFAGPRAGVTREVFEAALQTGDAEALVHRFPVATGDFLFVPSGRLHAIGGGIVIFEIQQNSDTTYRVFDWNRVGLDGRPRALHVAESLASIDFDDREPAPGRLPGDGHTLAVCEHFRVERHILPSPGIDLFLPPDRFAIVTVVAGTVTMGESRFGPGDFFLVPAVFAGAKDIATDSPEGATVLLTRW